MEFVYNLLSTSACNAMKSPMLLRHKRTVPIVSTLIVLCLLYPNHVLAECLADVHAAASGDLGYRVRGTRCEGLLRRFVASSPSVDLLGYQFGSIDLGAQDSRTISIVALGSEKERAVALRAMSLTSRIWYQMDSAEAKLGQPFTWPREVVVGASTLKPLPALDPTKLGLIACSNHCADRPDTTYWPVGLSGAVGGQAEMFSLLLRSDTRATALVVRLRTEEKTIEIPVPGVSLFSDGVLRVRLPAGLIQGDYKLSVEARDERTDVPLGVLFATIHLPVKSK